MKVKIKIKGMDCASDAHNVEESLLGIEGVTKAVVNYVVETIFVDCDIGVTRKDLERSIIETGLEVVDIKFDK